MSNLLSWEDLHSTNSKRAPVEIPAAPCLVDEHIVSVTNLESSEWYLNRELSWLEFTGRVLHEASDRRNPLLERVRFLAIVGSNLDEFFMKRIGGLKQQIAARVHEPTVDGRTPKQQIQECYAVIAVLNKRQQQALAELVADLRAQGILLESCENLNEEDRRWTREYYIKNVFPLVTPQAMDRAHPFPFVSNLSLNLLVSVNRPGEASPLLARVKVPVGTGIPRFVRIRDSNLFVRLGDIMAANLDLLFPGMAINSVEHFRVTRNADVVSDEEEADDLLALIQSELRNRKFAPIVRLEVSSSMSEESRQLLAAQLDLDQQTDVFEQQGTLAMRDLAEIAALDFPEFHYPKHRPVDHPALVASSNIFHAIRECGAILIHHPYESFSTSVEQLIRDASNDPKVRAIKMTLYRTSDKAHIVQHLLNAARNDKQVTVVVELKARFDEEANMRWASKLENAGIHVTYGVVGLKTHCKLLLIVRQDYDGLRRYVHIGTGNYNEETAQDYSDLGLITSDPEIGRDATELFNYLTTGIKPKRLYLKLLPAPKLLKPALLEKIAREQQAHRTSGKGLIRIKTNAIEDVDVCKALYKASQAGVRIELIVRDTCRLRPGVPGLSDTIQVVSIVGRFLEHSRICYFHNGGNEEYYIGSSDWMMRSLTNRVEVLAPISSPDLQQELKFILDTQLADRRNAWEMRSDGSYQQRDEASSNEEGSQSILIKWYEQRHTEATRLRKRKPRSLGGGGLLDEL